MKRRDRRTLGGCFVVVGLGMVATLAVGALLYVVVRGLA